MTERAELEKAIAVLEAQRTLLGSGVVDAAITPLRQQLIEQEQSDRQAGATLPGERKLITILFADVVGSTALAERLGGETTRLILDRCLRRASEAVDGFDGNVSGLMGDGRLYRLRILSRWRERAAYTRLVAISTAIADSL